MTSIALLTRILQGDLSTRAQGFILALPTGYRLERGIDQALLSAYGTATHPDVRRLAPEGAGDFVKVDSVRDSQPFLVSTATGKNLKTFLVNRADRMNVNAQNALLKPLEEPTRHTRIILITDNPSGLLPTIRSRCALYSVEATPELAAQEVLALLAEEGKPPSLERITVALENASGNPSLAARIIKHDLDGWLEKVRAYLSGKDATPPLVQVGTKTSATLSDAVQALQSMMVRVAYGELGMNGWTPARAADGAWVLSEMMNDISRAGIDGKTRIHAALCKLKAVGRV